MKLNNIKKELKGYFLNRFIYTGDNVTEDLCKKIDDTHYEVLGNVDTPNGVIRAYTNCLNQINNQLLDPGLYVCSLSEVLPVINGNIFQDYYRRAKQIEKHNSWLECVKTDKNKHNNGNHLVKWKDKKFLKYAFVYDKELVEINEILLSDNDKANAVIIKYPKLLRKALKDDLNNEYESAYLKEVKKYKNI